MFWKRKAKEPEVEGYIGHYGLADWWLSEFTEEERDFIETWWQPFGASGNATLTRGAPGGGRDPYKFLYQLAGWFKRKDQVPLALKMLRKARDFEAAKVTDKHFFYDTFIEVRYKQRDDDPGALPEVVKACEEMIAIAPLAAQAFRDEQEAMEAQRRKISEKAGLPFEAGEFQSLPPSHKGYQQLITIRKKQGDKAEAERLQKEFETVWK